MRELPRFFQVSVKNKHYGDNPPLWKHTVLEHAPRLSDDVFCVCLVKDPFFWVQSLGRDPAGGTFYELQPVEVVPDDLGGGANIFVQEPSSASQLFGSVLFDGQVYPDALALWEAAVRAYLDEDIFPSWRTAVVRCEDFLFDFEGVMTELQARGLELRHEPFSCSAGGTATAATEAPAVVDAASSGGAVVGGGTVDDTQVGEQNPWQPLDSTAKDASHPPCTRRGRQELLDYYRDEANRHRGLSTAQLLRLRSLAPDFLRFLKYGPGEAPRSWLPAGGPVA